MSTDPEYAVFTNYIDRHIDAPLEYAHTDEDKITLIESRWAADQIGEAILEQHDAGALSHRQMQFMLHILERWYFWPLDPDEQLRTTARANQEIANFKRK